MYDDDEQVDITRLKYVLYARKSRTDEFDQIRSVGDQITECKILAQRLGIHISAIVSEHKSAKKPGRREEFNTMLADIRRNKYDAILAWHPDRLARNMKEGGQIIDMVDEKIVQDLKFVTHHFSPDANGKMLLGMAFVLSKQYSDKLSQDVTRGVRNNLKEGKSSGTFKHGYIRAEDGRYVPDGKNFDLVCDAWRMRREGQPQESIAQYMNMRGYARVYKEGAKRAGEKVLMTNKILSSNVFLDPFYYGVLVQKGKQVDLRAVPGYDFKPATDEETYNVVQAMSGRSTNTSKSRSIFKPLVGMVICAYCQRNMHAQTPRSGRTVETRILSYRCDTPYCVRHNEELHLHKSVRAKVILDFMYKMLENFKVTKADYDKLVEQFNAKNEAELQEQTIKIHSKEGALKAIRREISDRSLKIISHEPTSPIYKANDERITQLALQQEHDEDELEKLRTKLTNPKEDLLSFEEFLNVANTASLRLKAADVATKDRIARLIYLNVTVDDQNVVDYQIREPFKTYFRMLNIVDGRGCGI